ncbi:ricin-type beta-trefoil lectin domain protein [Streptomyces umbrinus]|uniref:ricin-type beta-trefoil lectin domain protein n=1 Tax=Streptomyces umbrinus TaxID=67370 RepID=UPI0033FF1C7C
MSDATPSNSPIAGSLFDATDERLTADLKRGSGKTPAQYPSGELLSRHWVPVFSYARLCTNGAQYAGMLTTAAFTRLFGESVRRTGPKSAWRPQLLVAVRRIAGEWDADKRRELLRPELRSDPNDKERAADRLLPPENRRLVSRAFHRLPESARCVLWHAEVEAEDLAVPARLLGISVEDASVALDRARELLRQNCLENHRELAPDEECRRYSRLLDVSLRPGGRICPDLQEHMADCPHCQSTAGQLDQSGGRLAGLLAEGVLGWAAQPYLHSRPGRRVRAQETQAGPVVSVAPGMDPHPGMGSYPAAPGPQPGTGNGAGANTGAGTGPGTAPGFVPQQGTGHPPQHRSDTDLYSDTDSVWGPSPRQAFDAPGPGPRPDLAPHAGAGAHPADGPSADPGPGTGSHPTVSGHASTANASGAGSHRDTGRRAGAGLHSAGPRHAVRLPPHADARPGEPGRRSPRRRNLALAILAVSGCVLVPLALWSGGDSTGQPSSSDAGTASQEPDSRPTRVGTGGTETGTLSGRLRNVGSGDCVGIADGKATAGVEATVATCSSSERQQWAYESDGLLRSLADKDLCLDSRLPSSVRLGPCDGEKDEVSVRYDLTLEGNLVPLGRPKLALAPVSGDEETGLVLKTRSEGKAQRWEIDTSVDSLQMEWITSYTNSDTAKPTRNPGPAPTRTPPAPPKSAPSQTPPPPPPPTPAPAPSWVCYGYYCWYDGGSGGGYGGGSGYGGGYGGGGYGGGYGYGGGGYGGGGYGGGGGGGR